MQMNRPKEKSTSGYSTYKTTRNVLVPDYKHVIKNDIGDSNTTTSSDRKETLMKSSTNQESVFSAFLRLIDERKYNVQQLDGWDETTSATTSPSSGSSDEGTTCKGKNPEIQFNHKTNLASLPCFPSSTTSITTMSPSSSSAQQQQRPRSKNILIKSKSNRWSNNDETPCSNDPNNSSKKMYDWATWRMYHRITTARNSRRAVAPSSTIATDRSTDITGMPMTAAYHSTTKKFKYSNKNNKINLDPSLSTKVIKKSTQYNFDVAGNQIATTIHDITDDPMDGEVFYLEI